ncbi:MAG: response regulator [Erysipelotrichaceae bacterium]|nr:response regulator [Erysipelotrichaceae bacterium]
MFNKKFELNEETMSIVEEIGSHMPGGFFIYKAEKPEELLYANKEVLNIFGCKDLAEFKELTGYTFKGMLHPEDYALVEASIDDQIAKNDDNLDYVEYRIIRKDGTVRWVDDYGHYAETETYGGIYYVFISDITEKREKRISDVATRQAVIEALSESYHTVWMINDVETESFSLYSGDLVGDTVHAAPIEDALTKMKYSQAKDYYIQTMVAEKDRERLLEELDIRHIVERLSRKPQYNINYLRLMDDGSERYFRIEFARVNMPNGKMGVVCGFKDVDDDVREGQAMQRAIQEGKKAEEEKARLMQEVQSAAKLADLMASVASLLSNMPAMSFSKDVETGRYLACNQAFADYAQKASPDDVVGLTDYELFDRQFADQFVADDKKAIAMDEPYIYFEDVPDAAGNMRYLQTTKLKFTDSNGKLCTLGMCVDVTEMSRAKAAEVEARVKQQELEEKLALHNQLIEQEKSREQQNKLITALASDYWSVYYLELDKNEGVCYQSHADVDNGFKVGEHFKYLESVTAYANQYITDAYREEFLRFVQPEAIKEKLKDQRVISYRYMVNRHGRESYEMVKFAGVRHPEDRDDHLVHSVGACFTNVDLETRKSLAQSQALSDALETAEQASKAKTTFLSNMSHEIRTPMNAIIGLNNIALNDPEVTDKAKEYFTKIDASAKHLLSIINDILDMSRIESGRMIIRNEEFSFSKVLEQVNTIISGQCRDKGIHYECRIHGKIDDHYIGDDMKLRQVLINILGNAVKFTESGGNVTFTIDEIARFDKKATLRFTIKDNGIGMSKEYLPKLFEAFSQENASTAHNLGSTGLGMPITKNIVELMNGNIGVESEKGVGSTFTVTLTFEESARNDSDRGPHDFDPNEISVLVIDDDPIACEHARLTLAQVGVSCDIAESGPQALDMVRMHHLRRTDYHLILVDWKMPDMDGVETTRQIREIVGSDTPIIILTSYNWDDIVDEATQAGVDSFVPKPLFAGTVLDEFKEAFKKKNELLFASKADLKGRRILLAEDVQINAEIMLMVLNAREIEAELAENGQLALDMFVSHPEGYYDAILMDMRMPVMDGLEATRRIRAFDRRDAKEIPIIALTANAFDEDVQRSLQAGLNAHLSKPIDADSLFGTLESLIRD